MMDVVKAVRAWVIFAVAVAVPSVLSIGLALRAGERDARSMRSEAYEERVAALGLLDRGAGYRLQRAVTKP
jgi:hypothetical protein